MRMAVSVTVRVIGPAVSCVWAIGMMPFWDDEADRRLEADHEVVAGRAGDGAVRLGADRDGVRLAAGPTADPELDPQGSKRQEVRDPA